MTVVHLVPAMEQGGVESVVCDLNRALVRAGHVSVVISKGGRLVDRLVADGGRHIGLDLKSKNPLTAPWRAYRLRCVLRRLSASASSPLVCAHSRVPAWLYELGSRGLGLPYVTFAHGANSVSRYSSVMTRGELVLCPSQFLADYLKQNYRFDFSRIRVVHPAVDTAKFDPRRLDRDVVERLRQEWRLDGGRVLMAIGRVTPVKGYDSLIRDFAAHRYPYEKLVIIGGADRHHLDYLAKLQMLAADAGAPVVFAGQQEKIPECLSLADGVISANTTKPESFGLSVVEAMAMNKPVTAKRFGGVAEIMAEVEEYRRANPSADLRAAAVALYGFDRFAGRAISVFEEALR